MYRKQARRRRTALVALTVAALVLLSLQFSEADSGPLHTAQRGVATVLGPLEEGTSRVLKPARDLGDWFDQTFEARGTNDELTAEVQELRAELAREQGAIAENEELRELLELDKGAVAAEYVPVTSRVIARSPSVWYSTVTVDRGSSSGVEPNDPVVSADGLVGRVTQTTRGAAQVQLITDHRSAVSVQVLPDGPQGVLEAEAGNPGGDLLLQFVDSDQDVQVDQLTITAGWSDGRISSAYPRGLEIGRISKVEPGELGSSQRIFVKPHADMRELHLLQVLTGGPERPGVPK